MIKLRNLVAVLLFVASGLSSVGAMEVSRVVRQAGSRDGNHGWRDGRKSSSTSSSSLEKSPLEQKMFSKSALEFDQYLTTKAYSLFDMLQSITSQLNDLGYPAYNLQKELSDLIVSNFDPLMDGGFAKCKKVKAAKVNFRRELRELLNSAS